MEIQVKHEKNLRKIVNLVLENNRKRKIHLKLPTTK